MHRRRCRFTRLDGADQVLPQTVEPRLGGDLSTIAVAQVEGVDRPFSECGDTGGDNRQVEFGQRVGEVREQAPPVAR